MAIKCLKCDYEMSTYQEVTTFISVLIPSIVNLARDILSLYHGSQSGAVGFCSGPLNQMKAKSSQKEAHLASIQIKLSTEYQLFKILYNNVYKIQSNSIITCINQTIMIVLIF